MTWKVRPSVVAAAHRLVVLGASWVGLEAVGTARDMSVTFVLVVCERGEVDGQWLWPSCRGVHPRCRRLGWLPTGSAATGGGSGI